MNTAHMTTQFGLRPFFCDKCGESGCGTFILSAQGKGGIVNQKILWRVYCCGMTRPYSPRFSKSPSANITDNITGRVILSSRYG